MDAVCSVWVQIRSRAKALDEGDGAGLCLAVFQARYESARALAVALYHEDVSLRVHAVEALGEIGGETAIGLLQQALADHESSIREAAAEMLAELSSEER